MTASEAEDKAFADAEHVTNLVLSESIRLAELQEIVRLKLIQYFHMGATSAYDRVIQQQRQRFNP